MANSLVIRVRKPDGSLTENLNARSEDLVSSALKLAKLTDPHANDSTVEVRLERTGQVLNPNATLADAGIQNNDVLDTTPAESFDITIQTANRDRKADLGVDPDVRIGELLDMAKSQWALPGDYEYIIRCERLGRQLRSDETLGAAGVLSGDRLEIFPMADYGSQR